MGSSATIIAAVALATGLVCLLCGFFWGRSNVRSQVEGALDQARVSADAREYALREQLEETMLELSRSRARAEELSRSKEQRGQLNSGQVQASTNREKPVDPVQAAPKQPEPKQAPAPPAIDSTEKTIQNLLKSMEEKFNQPEEPAIAPQKGTTPAPAKLPDEKRKVASQKIAPPPVSLPAAAPRPATQQSARPAPQEVPPAKQPQPVKDEWQDFAASLEALTRRTK